MRARSIQLGVACLIAAASFAGAQVPGRGDPISGRWSLAAKTTDGPETRSLDLVMSSDSSVTGIISSSLGSVPIGSGRLDRDRLRFEFAMAGGEVRVSYDLVLKGDTLRGVFRQDGFEGEVLGVKGERVIRFPNRE